MAACASSAPCCSAIGALHVLRASHVDGHRLGGRRGGIDGQCTSRCLRAVDDYSTRGPEHVVVVCPVGVEPDRCRQPSGQAGGRARQVGQ